MRLLILIDNLSKGGAERFISHLTTHLPDTYDTTISVIDDHTDYAHRGSLHVIKLPPFTRRRQYHLHIIRWFKKLSTVRSLIKDLQPDVVFTVNPNWAFNAILFSRKVIFSIRVVPSKYFGTNIFQRLYIQFICSHAQAVICNSHGSARDLAVHYGITNARVIYNPLDVAYIQEEATKLPEHSLFNQWVAEKAPIFITAGRASRQKGHEYLIRAFATVRTQRQCKLVIMGAGVDTSAQLQTLIKELHITDDVLLLGFQHNPFAYLTRSTAFVFPSLFEGFPNALLEALACGLPTISTDCPSGPREILAPDTPIERVATEIEYAQYGILIPVGDEKKLAVAMRNYIDDATLRTRYTTNALKRAQHFDMETLMMAWLHVFGLHTTNT